MPASLKIQLRDWYARRRFALSAANHPLYLAYARRVYRPRPGSSQAVLDRFSRKLGRPVTFVQVGANDGITHDPVHLFIKRDGWRGVLLEPQALLCERYLRPLYAANPGVHVEQAAIGAAPGEATLYTLGFSEKRWATGVATFERDVLQAAVNSGHIARRAVKAGDAIPAGEELIVETQVPVTTPAELLARYGIERLDVLQVDTEGYDFEVIKLFDVSRLRPAIINYESAHLSDGDAQACRALLKAEGYTTRISGGDTIAVQPEYVRLLDETAG